MHQTENASAQIKQVMHELLKDHKEHTRKEIIDKASQTFKREYTPGEVSGAIRTYLTEHDYVEKLKAGLYRYPVHETEEECVLDVEDILNNTLAQLRTAANKVNFVDCTNQEWEKLKRIREIIKDIEALKTI